jgi:uncharacterized protein
MNLDPLVLQWWHPVLSVMLGYLVLGITGFGSALVIVPLLAWKWPLPEVVALTLLLDVPTSAWFGGLNFKQVQGQEVRRLLPAMALGMAAGLWCLSVLEPRWPLLLLGVYVVITGLRALRAQQQQPAAPASPKWAHVAGAAVGWVELMFGAAGPVVLAWLQRRVRDVHELRATTPVVIVCAASGALLFMAAAGQLSSPALWQRWAVLIGVALLAVTAGHRLSRHVPVARLKRAICGLLVASGVMLMWRATR